MGERERKKIMQFVAIFCALFIAVATRIAQLQITKGKELSEDSLNRRTYTQKLTATRGEIIDRNGTAIVSNRKSYNVYLVPIEYQEELEDNENIDINADSKKIAGILDLDPIYVKENLMKEKSYYRLIKKDISSEKVKELQDLDIAGIGIETATVRNYPQKGLLANVIGFVGSENQGLEGLEATYQSRLAGTEGLLIVERDRKGNKIPNRQHNYVSAKQGQTLKLTIDSGIQYIMEDELKKLYNSNVNPTSVYAVVQDPNSGQILGMASYPTYDPADGGNSDIANRKNGVVSFNFEPGSTFKLITMASALDSGAVNKNTTIEDSTGGIKVGKHTIRNWDRKARGTLTLGQAATHSNNVAMVKMSGMMGKETLYNYMSAFGLGSKTNVGLYSEEAGLLKNVENVSNLDLAANSIGQSLMVTPIQLVNSVSAIVNGGTLYQPYIIKEFLDSDGEVVADNKPTALRQVISKETSDTMRGIMKEVVENGGANAAKLEGFNIGGKTGTAQKVSENSASYTDGCYVTSFVCAAPIDNPKYTLAIVVNEPKSYPYYASSTAVPTGANIMKRIMLANKDVDASSLKDTEEKTSDKE